MTEYEKVEKLREKADVTYEEARAALEAADWDLLEAIVLLEKEGKVRSDSAAHSTKRETEEPAEETPSRKNRFAERAGTLWEKIRRLIQIGNENFFIVTRKDEEVLRLPVTVLAILLICAFAFVAIVLVVGLFCGLKYSIHGEQLGKPIVNDVMDKAANAAENVRETVEDSLRNGK